MRFLLWVPLLSLLSGKAVEMTLDSAKPLALVVVLAAFALLVISAQVRLKAGRIDAAVGLLLAGFVIADALAICTTSPVLALVFVAVAPMLRFWQRWVAAT